MSNLIQQHLDDVRRRIESQGLSVLELREQAFSRLAEAREADGSKRERLQAEATMISEMVRESLPAEPSPAERVEALRAQGQNDMADTLQRTLNIQAKRDEVSALEAKLLEEQGKTWGSTEKVQADLDKARGELYDAQRSVVPVHQAEMDRRRANLIKHGAAKAEEPESDAPGE